MVLSSFGHEFRRQPRREAMQLVRYCSPLLAVLLMLAGCGTPAPAAPPLAEGAAPTAQPPAHTQPGAPVFHVGVVTDLGGIDDKSFNALAWQGARQAAIDFGAEAGYKESGAQGDYPGNIQKLIDGSDDLVITVGYLLVVDTALAARAFPQTKFAIVDNSYPDCWPGAVEGQDCGSSTELPNVRGLTFQTDEAAYLAGYLAAGMTRTGKVATFGGIKLPTVTIFMKGFAAGVQRYNTLHNSAVEVLGWNTQTDSGVFVDNFESISDGRTEAESFLRNGADIIMPVAGPVGQGSAAVCKETRACLIIGVDSDWYLSTPQYKEVILTSVTKQINTAVYD